MRSIGVVCKALGALCVVRQTQCDDRAKIVAHRLREPCAQGVPPPRASASEHEQQHRSEATDTNTVVFERN